jgi:hypothetical protein
MLCKLSPIVKSSMRKQSITNADLLPDALPVGFGVAQVVGKQRAGGAMKSPVREVLLVDSRQLRWFVRD